MQRNRQKLWILNVETQINTILKASGEDLKNCVCNSFGLQGF